MYKYRPKCTTIFGSKNINFNIANYSIEGNKILGKKIYSKLFNLSKSKMSWISEIPPAIVNPFGINFIILMIVW